MARNHPQRPVPNPVAGHYQAFYGGLAEGRVLIPRCAHCGTLHWPPREVCGRCQHTEFGSADFPAHGRIYTFTVVYRAFHPWFAERVPYGIVVGDLGRGVRIMGNLFGPEAERLECGLPVAVDIARDHEVPILQWRLLDENGLAERGRRGSHG